MKGIVVAVHGSRSPEVKETVQYIMAKVRRLLPDTWVQEGYLGMGSPSIVEGLEILREKGVDRIILIPYFLFRGIHVKETIPEILADYQKQHPAIEIEIGHVLGEDARLAAVLADRIREVI